MAAVRVCDRAHHKTQAPRRGQLKRRALSWLTLLAIGAWPASLLAQTGVRPSNSTPSCMSGSDRVKAAQEETTKPRLPLLVSPSLHQAAARSFRIAQEISKDAQLFGLDVSFDERFPELQPGWTGFDMT